MRCRRSRLGALIAIARGRRVLLYGHSYEASIERCWLEWLRESGYEADVFDPAPSLRAAAKVSIIERILWRVSPSLLARAVSRDFVQTAERLRPDLVLVVSGNFVTATAVDEIRRLGSMVVHFLNEDFFNRGNTGPVLRDAAGHYDHFFTTKSFNVAELAQVGVARVTYLPHGYRPHCHYPVSVPAQALAEYGSAVTFVGTFEQPRAAVLERLAGCDLKIWGNQWNKVGRRSPLRSVIQHRDVYCAEMSAVFNASGICLAFLRRANRDRHTSRTFEIPACGGFQLAERSDEVLSFFDEGHEIECFEDGDELVDKVRFYTAHESERRRIAAAGRARLLRSRYSFTDRMEDILSWAGMRRQAPCAV